jgi:hypothetical protein
MTGIYKAILSGGAACGALDGMAAITLLHFQGIGASRVWKGVASGLIGSKSFQIGWPSTALGLFLHFSIALVAALVFSLAAQPLPWLLNNVLAAGAFYGVTVYIVMNLIVVPLSARPKKPFTTAQIVSQIIIHVVCVGLPITSIANYFARCK